MKNALEQLRSVLEEKGLSKEEVKDVLADFDKATTISMSPDELQHALQEAAEKALKQAGLTRDQLMPGSADEPTKGFKNFGDFITAIRTNESSDRMKTLTTTDPGQYLIPVEYANDIIKTALDDDIFGRSPSVNISGNTYSQTYRVDKNHADGSRFGGIQFAWEAEGATADTESNVKFGTVEWKVNKLFGLITYTEEMMADGGAGLVSELRTAFADELRFILGNYMLNGTGSGQPLGIFNSPALITVAKETSQAAVSLLRKNIYKMYQRMWARGRSNAVWVINDTLLPEIMDLQAGDSSPLYQFNAALSPQGTLLGRPVVSSEHVPTLGDAKDISFIDFSQYKNVIKGAAKFAESMHVYFLADKNVMKVTFRIDGQPLWETYITPKKGNTQSPFVTLAERA